MGKRNYYKKGDYTVYCDRSGFMRKASQCRMQWNGLLVAKEFFEERQPQDYVKGLKDKQTVPICRPQNIVYLEAGDVTPEDL